MNFIQVFAVLNMFAMFASASNPTYWTRKTGVRTVATTSKPVVHDLSPTEGQVVLNCNLYRNWECALESDLTTSQAFCKRLATNQPIESDHDHNGPDRFASFRDFWVRTYGSELYVESNYCHKPTDEEKQMIENCYFARTLRQKKLTVQGTFCRQLANEKPTATDATSMRKLLSYRKEWAKMTDVGRQDFNQLVECSALENYYGAFPELLTHNCFHFFELIKKPKTLRDIRRKRMHYCWAYRDSLSGKQKFDCMCVLHTYKQLYYPDDK